MLLHDICGPLWFSNRLLFLVSSMNAFIYFAVSTSFLFYGIKMKSLMNFSLSLFHWNVSPHASSILYHLFGNLARVKGNRCGHVRSSL